jgi:hypothetical protein
MGTMHAAKLENSPRLQRVRALLSDGAWHGTRDIIHRAEVCAVNSVISELRASGVEIASRCVGVGRYESQLVIPAGQGELF